VPPDFATRVAAGNRWAIFLDGVIDNDAPRRFERELDSRGVQGAVVTLNSPGGNLHAALRLGRLFRQRGLSTNVGSFDGSYFGASGECLSACVVAYAGGYFRFAHSGSLLGVHRLSSPQPTTYDLDIGQVVSASVTQYLQEMGVDVRLFARMTATAKDSISVLTRAEAVTLGLVDDGRRHAQWSIEATDRGLYLRGVQETWRGEGKIVMTCGKGTIIAMPLYGVGANAQALVDLGRGQSLVVNGRALAVPSEFHRLFVDRGYAMGTFVVGTEMRQALLSATSVGWAVDVPVPGLFFGFEVEVEPGAAAEKVANYVRSCLAQPQ
jgi:hypothetical protein